MSAEACPFCAIAAGKAPATMVVDDGAVIAFMDWRQAVNGHVLVLPRRHVPDIYALTSAEAAAVMTVAVSVAKALRSTYSPPGLNLWQSNGDAGGQEVEHFHLHVHPRRSGDGLLRVYPKRPPAPSDPAQLDAMAKSLREHLEA